MRVLAIDPGRDKCGAAAMEGWKVLARAVVPPRMLIELVTDWSRRYDVKQILVGNRTGSREVAQLISAAFPNVTLTRVAETGTTLAARRRYFRDHPPHGWRRLIPVTLQVPPRPYDDYAAIVLAERFHSRSLSTDTQ